MAFPKKYIVFAWNDYYPAGGLGDIKESFETLEEAERFVQYGLNYDHASIVNRDTWEEMLIDVPLASKG